MIYFTTFCCVCLNEGEKLVRLLLSPENGLSYYDKLNKLIPEMDINEIKETASICESCKNCTDTMYEFRTKCLNNNNTLQNYLTHLRSMKQTSHFVNVKQEVFDENPNEYETIHVNVNQGLLQPECTIQDYMLQLRSAKENVDTTPNLVLIKEEVEIPDDDSLESNTNQFGMDAEKSLKHEAPSDDSHFSLTSESYESNMNYNDQLGSSTRTNLHQNDKETNADISLLHTELDIDSPIKKEAVPIIYDKFNIQLENVPEYDHTNLNIQTNAKDNTNQIIETGEKNINETSGNNADLEYKDHEGKYICKICNISFTQLHDFKRHNALHTDEKTYACEICNKTFRSPNNLTKHVKIHTDQKPFECETCFKTFSLRKYLVKHYKSHTDEKPYQCEICNKTFPYSSSLKSHMILHAGIKPYTCDICNKSFTQRVNLELHNRIHTGEKPYTCDICNKSFAWIQHFNKHKMAHSGLRPYECNICNKTFTQSSSLTRHYRTHTGEKPYKCEICNKTFPHLLTLQNHTIIHTGQKSFECNICNKSFSLKKYLLLHNKIHTDEKPYKCEKCNKTFSLKKYLLAHDTAMHNTEKSYKCDICNKSFNQLPNLKRHIIIHNSTVTNTSVTYEQE